MICKAIKIIDTNQKKCLPNRIINNFICTKFELEHIKLNHLVRTTNPEWNVLLVQPVTQPYRERFKPEKNVKQKRSIKIHLKRPSIWYLTKYTSQAISMTERNLPRTSTTKLITAPSEVP